MRLAADGTIYAVAVNGSQGGESRATDPHSAEPARPPVPSVSTEITTITVMDSAVSTSSGQPQPPRPARRGGRGAIYRIGADGLWDILWDSGEDAPYDLVIEPSGSLLVGTGTEGKIFRVSGNPARATLLARATARQVTALLREPSGRIIGAASNPGKLFALSPTAARRGTYESDVRDAGTVASWGAIRWRASAKPRRDLRLHAHREHRDAGRNLERVVEGVHQRRRRTDREPERALPAVARRLHDDGQRRGPC